MNRPIELFWIVTWEVLCKLISEVPELFLSRVTRVAMRIMNDVPLKFLCMCMCYYMHCIVVDVADSRMISLQCLSK